MAFCTATAQQETVGQISITVDSTLNPQRKVTAHMKTKDYDGPIGIKLRGNSSLGFNQKKYTLETRQENGKEQDVSLLGMPAHSKWVLLAPYNDISMMRDPLDLHRVRNAAGLHGGVLLLECLPTGEFSAVMRIPCDRAPETLRVSPVQVDRSGGFSRMLIELSDVLPDDVYDSRNF